MNCVELRSELALRAFDLGREAQSAAWSEHLSQCSQCERELKIMRSLGDWPDPAPVDPHKEDELWDVISARIDVEGDEFVQESRPPEKPIVIGLTCSYCHDSLDRSEASFCGSCLAPHHGDCFRLHGRCTVLGCDEVRTVKAAVDGKKASRVPRRSLPWFGVLFAVSGVAAFGASKLFLLGSDSGLGTQLIVPREIETKEEKAAPKFVADIEALNAKLEKFATVEEREQQRAREEAERKALEAAKENLKEAKKIFQSLENHDYERAIALLETIPKVSQYYKEAQAWKDFGAVEVALSKAEKEFCEGSAEKARADLANLFLTRLMTPATKKRVKQRIALYRSISNDDVLLKLALKKADFEQARSILERMKLNSVGIPHYKKLCQDLLDSLTPDLKRRDPAIFPDVITGWKWTPNSFAVYWKINPKNRFLRIWSSGLKLPDGRSGPMVYFFDEEQGDLGEMSEALKLSPKDTIRFELETNARFNRSLKPYFPDSVPKNFVVKTPFEMAPLKITWDGMKHENRIFTQLYEVKGSRLEPQSVLCRAQSVELHCKDVEGERSYLSEIQLFRKAVGADKYELIKTIKDPEKLTLIDQTVKRGETYHYLIRARSFPDRDHPFLQRFENVDWNKLLTWDVEVGPVKMLPSAN